MTTEARKNDHLAAAVFAAFAVACLIAFLWFRGSDVGQLPKLVGNLGGGPFFGPAIGPALYGLGTAVFIFIAWLGLGSIVDRLVDAPKEEESEFTFVARSTALGAATWSVVWFFLGLANLFNSISALACFIVGLTLALFGVFSNVIIPRRLPAAPSVIFWVVSLPLLFAFISSLAPPIGKDSLLYHFALPKMFVEQGGSSFVTGNIASYLSLGLEMHYVWAALLGGLFSPRAAEAATGASGFLSFPLLLMVIIGWAKELRISRIWSGIATLLVAAIPTAYHVATSGYIDVSLVLYITLATYSLTRWWKEQRWGWAVLIGIFLGAALSVKLTSVFVIAAFALIVLLRARGSKNPAATAPGSDSAVAESSSGRILATGFAALLLAGVIASPWYLRTWAATGSPVFPFYMSIWKGTANGWDVERSNLFQGMNSQYGGADQNKLNYLTAPVRVSIAAQPEQPANYDGVLGVAFLIGLPLLVWALWKLDLGVEIKIMAGVAGIMYLFWLFSSEQLRYLLPIVPLLAIAIAASAERIGGNVARVAKCAFVAAAMCGVLTSFSWFCQKAPVRVVLGGETRDEYLTRNLDYYRYYQEINANTPPDAKVWLINMRRDTYNIERPVFSDYLFEDWTLRKMLWESMSVEELRAKTKAMGISYVLTRHDFLFDYASSTLVDDKRPRTENEAKLKIAKDFILDPANTVRSDGKFSLIKVF